MVFENIANAAGKLYGQVIRVPRERTEAEKLADSIQKARSDLERAEALFNEITNPEMVDYISYDIMAAKSRYSYLLRQAKENNIHL